MKEAGEKNIWLNNAWLTKTRSAEEYHTSALLALLYRRCYVRFQGKTLDVRQDKIHAEVKF